MKELPLLVQSNKIESGSGGGNFGAAFSQVAQADLQVAEFGANIAQSASSQRAKLAGIEAGQNPQGREPLVLTKTDAEYANAYNQQAMATLDFAGKKAIGDMFSTLAVNPTAEGMSLFKKSSLGEIDKLVNQAPKSLQPDLRRSLESTAQNNFYSLNNAFETRNRKDRLDSTMASTDESLISASNMAQGGDLKGALESLKRDLAAVQDLEIEGIVPIGTANKLRRQADQTLNNGQAIYQLNNSENKEKYLAGMENEAWLKNLPADERDAAIKNTVSYYAQQQAAKSTQQSINYTNYQTKLIGSTMSPTDWIQAESEVNGEQFSKLKQMQVRMNLKEDTNSNLINKANEHWGDYAYWAANFTQDQVNKIVEPIKKAYAESIGKTSDSLDLHEEIKALSGVDYPVQSLSKRIDASIQHGDIGQAILAAKEIEGVKALGNDNLLSGVSDQAKIMSSLLNNASVGNMDDKKLDDLRRSVYNATPEQKKAGKEAVNDFIRDEFKNDSSSMKSHILSNLKNNQGSSWFSSDKLPVEAMSLYENYLNAYSSMTSDANLADQMALEQINKTFTRTTINGENEFMANTVESQFPNNGKYGNENMKRLAVAKMIAMQTLMLKPGDTPFATLSWPDMPTEGNPLDNNTLWGKSGDLIIDYKVGNGDPEKIKIIIQSDALTNEGIRTKTTVGFNVVDKKEITENNPNWAIKFEYVNKKGLGVQSLPFSDKPYTALARMFPREVEREIRSNKDLQKALRVMVLESRKETKIPNEAVQKPEMIKDALRPIPVRKMKEIYNKQEKENFQGQYNKRKKKIEMGKKARRDKLNERT